MALAEEPGTGGIPEGRLRNHVCPRLASAELRGQCFAERQPDDPDIRLPEDRGTDVASDSQDLVDLESNQAVTFQERDERGRIRGNRNELRDAQWILLAFDRFSIRIEHIEVDRAQTRANSGDVGRESALHVCPAL